MRPPNLPNLFILLATTLPSAITLAQQSSGPAPEPNAPAAWIACEFDPPPSFRKYGATRGGRRLGPTERMSTNDTLTTSTQLTPLPRGEKLRARGDVNDAPDGDDDARLVIEIDTNWMKFGNFDATVRNGGKSMWTSRCRFDCGFYQDRADWQTMFSTPQIDAPLEMHAGNWCHLNSNSAPGWAFDNFWIRYKDYWNNIPDSADCEIERGFSAFGGGGLGWGPWKKLKCRIPLDLKE